MRFETATSLCTCDREPGVLTPFAVYCPACGHRLIAGPAIATRHASLMSAVSHCVHRFLPAAHTPEAPLNLTPAAVVTGYARALFSLGWRYERGGEVRRNLNEAVRCYRKSARLGNTDAIGRLIPADDGRTAVPVLPMPEE